MDSDGSNPTRLTNIQAIDVEPVFSPDGSQIAFSSFRDGNEEIYLMNSDGPGNANNLTNNPAFDVDPSWGAPANNLGPPPADQTPPQAWLRLWPTRLAPPDGRMVPVTATLRVQDDHDPQPAVRLEAITHNGASDSSADVSGAEFGTDDRAFSLRADSTDRRRARRVYTVVYSVTVARGPGEEN